MNDMFQVSLIVYTKRPDKHGRVFPAALSSVRFCTPVHWTSHVFYGTRNTRP